MQGRRPPYFPTKKKPAQAGDVEEQMKPASSKFWMELSMTAASGIERE
jgi:hypothetical protein